MGQNDQPPCPPHGRDGTDAIAFHGVSCVRGARLLFEALSFTVPPGGAILVSGPNGAGKSSLIRIAAGLLRPAQGHVSGAASRTLMAETAALDPAVPLARALTLWARLDPDAADPRGRVARGLDAVGLAHLAEVPVRLLSTGQRRRAALARVVASGARLWLLDEPASGLDVASVAMLERLIADHRAGGGAVLLATHQPIALADAMTVRIG